MNRKSRRLMGFAGRAAVLLAAVWCPAVSAEEGPITAGVTIEAGAVRIQINGGAAGAIEVDPAGDPAVVVEAAVEGDPLPAVPLPRPRGVGAAMRGLIEAFAPQPQQEPALPLEDTDDGEMPKDPRKAQLWMQRKQIREHAKNLEQAFEPMLRSELEMVRQTCGSLSPEDRRPVLAAGRTAVKSTALKFAAMQMGGAGPGRAAFDSRSDIQESLCKAVEPHVPAAEFAAYQRELELRRKRRQRAARVAIVARLDRRLDLAEAQRQAIEADLERQWEASWVRGLNDQQVIVNNERPAPDYADACISPHLDAGQHAEWLAWRRAAGSAVTGMSINLDIGGQGLHQEDDWWTK